MLNGRTYSRGRQYPPVLKLVGIWVDESVYFFSFFFLILTRGNFLIAFRERERERETSMRERSIDLLSSVYAWTKDQTCNIGICPDRESNLQPFGYGMMLQPTEPH